MFRVIILLCKGILRDTRMRRNVMMWLMLAAMVMLFLGELCFSHEWARQHWLLYFGYWAFCAWVTLAAVLLAIFDILIIRATARAMRRRIEQDIANIDARTKGERE